MSGYLGIGPEEGAFVPGEKAYGYALERCLSGTEEEQEEFREMLVEWYYSGNWIKEEESNAGN
jgi:hypothetical protein